MGDTPAEKAKLGGAMREKYWNELTSDEKVERMRGQLKVTMRQLEEMTERLYATESLLKRHEHMNGKVVQEADRGYEKVSSLGRLGSLTPFGRDNPDAVYF